MAETIALPGGGQALIRWRRSPRARRLSLRIDAAEAAVIVTLPNRASRRAGLALLDENAGWVAARLAALPPGIRFAPGALLPIEGVPHAIRHLPRARGGAWIAEGEVCVAGEAAFLRRRVADFLRAEARRRLSPLALGHAAGLGRQPRRILIKDTRSRWGSCAADGTLAFSWRLVMAPRFVQSYVTAHEVAHLRHLHHGPAFWALVEVLCPGWQAAGEWLQVEGPGLLRIGASLAADGEGG
ncbi:M48 family metallopeptidase [Acidisoma sp. C75]